MECLSECTCLFFTAEAKEEAVEPTKIPEKLTLDLKPHTNQAWAQVLFPLQFVKV